MVIYDSSFVKNVSLPSHVRAVPIPFSEIANELGNAKVANIVAAGAIIGLTGITGVEAFKSLLGTLKKDLLEANLKALAAGLAEAHHANDRMAATAAPVAG
jgi:2-oxoglutarate ferredoxin oxidoreductase subunit gamma